MADDRTDAEGRPVAGDRTDAEGRPVAEEHEHADRPNTEYEQGREDERVEEGRSPRT